MVKDGLVEFGLDNKSALRCKNMFLRTCLLVVRASTGGGYAHVAE